MMKSLFQAFNAQKYMQRRSISCLGCNNRDNTPDVFIIQTSNNMTPAAHGKTLKEVEQNYLLQSWKDLFSLLPTKLYNQTVLCIKIRQSVVLKKDWIEKGEAKEKGHLMTCLLKITATEIQPEQESFISKVKDGFEPEVNCLNNQFFTPAGRYKKAALNGSDEFYILIPAEGVLDTKAYLSRCREMRSQNSPYIYEKAACSHAGYEVCVGKEYKPGENERGLSPQTAAKYILEELILEKCHNPKVKEQIQDSMVSSMAFKNGYEKGQDWQDKQAQLEPEATTPGVKK